MTSAVPNDLLGSAGLGDLPPEVKQLLERRARTEIEYRVGDALARDVPEELLDEFETLIDGDESTARAWLDLNSPDWETRFAQASRRPPDGSLQDFACDTWLSIHRADYREVVRQVVEGVQAELARHREGILAAARRQVRHDAQAGAPATDHTADGSPVSLSAPNREEDA